jgi:erythromycin esterase-like protein
MAIDLEMLLDSRPSAVEVLALGEPTHAEPAFPRMRNQIFGQLAARGFRSIAVESDRIAGLAVDAYVRGADGTLDDVLAVGFSHGLGELAANRELVEWMRGYNRSVSPGERLAFHGFDAPLEMTGTPSPGPYLRHLRDYLGAHPGVPALPAGAGILDELIGDDAQWSDPAALMDAAKSIGRSTRAQALRELADDLLATLYMHAPRLTAASTPRDWQRARLHGTTALGLLRYHAVAADRAPAAERTSRLLGMRDAWMAQNLLDIRAEEQRRGPTLVFAHNRHLQRYPSTWRLAGMDLEWSSAGAIVSTLLGDRYAPVVGSIGASSAMGLDTPASDTFEGVLGAVARQGLIFGAAGLAALVGAARVRTDVTVEQGYFPLDAETVRHCEAVWHIDRFPAAAADIAARIQQLPGVVQLQAGPGTEAPEVSWDERFFFVGPDRRRPFATIVGHDIPGFDDQSRLDRVGVFRLNIELGRARFQQVFGYPPNEFVDHRDEIDFAAVDEIVPHPIYATYGWASVVNPGARSEARVGELLAGAHQRAVDREQRRAQREPNLRT